MENEQQQLPVQQKDEFPEYSDIERTKALFEYEMTEVLLGFKKEAVRFKRRDVSEYLDMELPQAGVDYTSPDISLKGIEYSETDSIPPLDVSVNTPQSLKAGTSEFTDINAIKLRPIISSKPEIIPVSGEMNIPQIEDIFSNIENAELSAVRLNLPETQSIKIEYDNNSISALSEGVPAVTVPEIKLQQSEKPAITVPQTSAHKVQFNAGALSVNGDVLLTEIPSVEVDVGKLSVGNIGQIGIQVSFPPQEKNDLSVSFEKISVEDLLSETDIQAEVPGICSVDADITPYYIQTADISVPAVDAYGLSYDIQPVPVSKTTAAADVSVLEISREAFDINAVKEFDINVSVPRAEPPVFSSVSDIETAAVDYPDIPEKPDFSDYYSDILDSIKTEI